MDKNCSMDNYYFYCLFESIKNHYNFDFVNWQSSINYDSLIDELGERLYKLLPGGVRDEKYKKINYLFEIFKERCPDMFINEYFTSTTTSPDLKKYLVHFINIVKKKRIIKNKWCLVNIMAYIYNCVLLTKLSDGLNKYYTDIKKPLLSHSTLSNISEYNEKVRMRDNIKKIISDIGENNNVIQRYCKLIINYDSLKLLNIVITNELNFDGLFNFISNDEIRLEDKQEFLLYYRMYKAETDQYETTNELIDPNISILIDNLRIVSIETILTIFDKISEYVEFNYTCNICYLLSNHLNKICPNVQCDKKYCNECWKKLSNTELCEFCKTDKDTCNSLNIVMFESGDY